MWPKCPPFPLSNEILIFWVSSSPPISSSADLIASWRLSPTPAARGFSLPDGALQSFFHGPRPPFALPCWKRSQLVLAARVLCYSISAKLSWGYAAWPILAPVLHTEIHFGDLVFEFDFSRHSFFWPNGILARGRQVSECSLLFPILFRLPSRSDHGPSLGPLLA